MRHVIDPTSRPTSRPSATRALFVALALLAALAAGGCTPRFGAVSPGELPSADTPVVQVASVEGAADIELALVGGRVAARVEYQALHLSTGELRDGQVAGEEGWAQCVMLSLAADLRPVLLRGVQLLTGDEPALWLARLLPRIDLEVTGPAAAIPDDALPLCEAHAGRLRVLAFGIDITDLLPGARPPAAPGTFLVDGGTTWWEGWGRDVLGIVIDTGLGLLPVLLDD